MIYKFVNKTATCSRWLFARGFFYPEDGGDTILRNVGSIDHIYTAPHPQKTTFFIVTAVKTSNPTKHTFIEAYLEDWKYIWNVIKNTLER
jgi:hypothetical protein